MYIYILFSFFILNSSLILGNRPLFPAKLSSWTSAQWKNKKLGGDTPYSKALAEKPPVVTCPTESPSYDTFHEWYKACQLLPRFKMHAHNPYATALDSKLFAAETEQLLDTIQKQHKKLHWIDGTQPADTCVDFQTYAEKLIIPDDSTVAIHGDLHGDIRSLNRFIHYCAAAGYMDKDNPFKIKAKNFYILFLGDYVDRGWYGAETLYTMMRLKNANPDRVFMVRGNHEDLSLNEPYGFLAELNKLKNPDLVAKIHDFYNQLPAVLYLGTHSDNGHNVIQCCHGGIEIGFDPQQLLDTSHNRAGMVITDLAQETACDHLKSPDLMPFKKYFLNKKIDTINGFMWNDFIVDPTISFSLSDRDGKQGTMFNFGQSATHTVLNHTSTNAHKIRSIFRAH